jgi:hypothetical protein
MGVGTQILDIFVRWHARVRTEAIGGLWCDACSKHVGTMTHVRRDGAGRKGAVEMRVVLEAAHTILERLEGRRRVTTTIAHTIIIGEIWMIPSPTDVGDPTLGKVMVMTIGKAFLMAVEREHGGVLYAGHGVAWCEWGDLAGVATVGGDVAHYVVRIAVSMGKCGDRV